MSRLTTIVAVAAAIGLLLICLRASLPQERIAEKPIAESGESIQEDVFLARVAAAFAAQVDRDAQGGYEGSYQRVLDELSAFAVDSGKVKRELHGAPKRTIPAKTRIEYSFSIDDVTVNGPQPESRPLRVFLLTFVRDSASGTVVAGGVSSGGAIVRDGFMSMSTRTGGHVDQGLAPGTYELSGIAFAKLGDGPTRPLGASKLDFIVYSTDRSHELVRSGSRVRHSSSSGTKTPARRQVNKIRQLPASSRNFDQCLTGLLPLGSESKVARVAANLSLLPAEPARGRDP